MKEAEWCKNGWDEIIPGLWMGGHYKADPEDSCRGVPAKVTDEFDLVVSLFSTDLHDCGPDIGVPNMYYRIPDGPLTILQRRLCASLASMVSRAVQNDLKVLVRCQVGLNRSGYVVAQVLMDQGHGPEEAVNWIRECRSPDALFNQHFLAYLGYCEQLDLRRD